MSSHDDQIETLISRVDKWDQTTDTLNIKINDLKVVIDKVADKTQNDLKNEIFNECRKIVKVRMDEMVDLVEKFAKLVKTTERKQKEFENHVEQKYALQSTRKDQIEDILKDHIELIKKLHSQQQGCNNSVVDLAKEVNVKIADIKNDMSIKNKLYEFEKQIKLFEGTYSKQTPYLSFHLTNSV